MFGRKVVACSIFVSAVMFFFALVENKTQFDVVELVSFSNIESTVKNIARPIAYASGVLKEPLVARRSDFVDRERFFIKTLVGDGSVSMREIHDGSLVRYFDSADALLVEGDVDAILERFNGLSNDRRIVFRRADPDFPMNLLKMLSSVVKHGVYDNSNRYEQSLEALRGRSLSMTCGPVSVFAQKLLSSIGVKSRVATTLTLEEWNTYDNGHTFLEVYSTRSGKWVAIDLDTKGFFSTPTIARASLLEMMEAGVGRLSFPSYLNVSTLDYSTLRQYQSIVEFAFLNKEEWYGRVLQVYALYDAESGKYIFATDDEATAKRIASYSSDYATLTVKEFASHFYGSN